MEFKHQSKYRKWDLQMSDLCKNRRKVGRSGSIRSAEIRGWTVNLEKQRHMDQIPNIYIAEKMGERNLSLLRSLHMDETSEWKYLHISFCWSILTAQTLSASLFHICYSSLFKSTYKVKVPWFLRDSWAFKCYHQMDLCGRNFHWGIFKSSSRHRILSLKYSLDSLNKMHKLPAVEGKLPNIYLSYF